MQSIGHRLRKERLIRQMSLEELANSTKIPASSLMLLESDRFSELPNDTIVKGFLKAICSVFGIDGEAIINEYTSRYGNGNGKQIRVFGTNKDRLNKISNGKLRFLLALIVFLLLGSILLLIIFTPRPTESTRASSAPSVSTNIQIK